MTKQLAKDAFLQTAQARPASMVNLAGTAQNLINMRITSIHEFVRLSSATERDLRLNTLSHLIHSQADMHESLSFTNAQKLGSAIEKRAHLFRGFVVHSEEGRPAAYCVYYPMLDHTGKRAAYCEDIFIVEAWRGYGIFNVVLNELAKRTLREGLEYVQWSTDTRNNDFLAASHKKGIQRADIEKYECPALMNAELCNAFANASPDPQKRYIAQPIEKNHLYDLETLGVPPELLTMTGEMDFRGFIVLDKENRSKPVAIAPGWIRMSTFRLNEHIVLEGIKVIDDHNLHDIVLSIGEAARKTRYESLLWHVVPKRDVLLESVLTNSFDAHYESMQGTPESKMLTHILAQPELNALAQLKVNMTVAKRADSPIGARRQPVAPPKKIVKRHVR